MSHAHPGRRVGLRRAVTFLTIAGTLCGCGRYGPPVRVAPMSETSPSEAANAPDEDAARADGTAEREGRDDERPEGAEASEPAAAPR